MCLVISHQPQAAGCDVIALTRQRWLSSSERWLRLGAGVQRQWNLTACSPCTLSCQHSCNNSGTSLTALSPPSCTLSCHNQQLTTCGLTAQSVQHAVASVAVPNQQLTYWPPALCQFTALTSINLSGNSLTFIPQSIKNLQGLQQLLVSRNALGCLPPEIGALTALTELGVGANSISKLPDGLCKLTGLKVCIVGWWCNCHVRVCVPVWSPVSLSDSTQPPPSTLGVCCPSVLFMAKH